MGFMTAAELATCLVAKDLASPALVEGNVVAFTAFHKRGFGVSPH
jgi:hypothetical protein